MKGSIEKYPHIIVKLTSLWPFADDGRKYLENLLMVTDRLTRSGFDDPDVFDEAFFLLQIHNQVFPTPKSPWDGAT